MDLLKLMHSLMSIEPVLEANFRFFSTRGSILERLIWSDL